MNTAIIIPAYNEARTIAEVAERACGQAEWVIVVDDGSDDGTAGQLKEMPVTLLRNERNQGKAASLWRGAAHAIKHGAKTIITLDGDGQHQPEDIPRLIEASRYHPRHIVIGARLNERNNVPAIRNFANRMANFWISWAAGYPIPDTQSGFRLYPVEVWKKSNLHHDPSHGFVLESEILIQGSKLGYYSTPVPVDSVYIAGARPSYYRPIVDTWRITRMVGWSLICRGMYPLGLLKSLGILPPRIMLHEGND